MDWNRMGWNVMEWNGMEWNGVEWSGTLHGLPACDRFNKIPLKGLMSEQMRVRYNSEQCLCLPSSVSSTEQHYKQLLHCETSHL